MKTIFMLFLLCIASYGYTQDNNTKSTLLKGVFAVSYKSTYKVDSSFVVSKINLKDIENPQVYVTIPKELLEDQVITNLNDAMRNATGVSRLWESTGRGLDGAEFYSMRGFSVQPTLINGVAGINNGTVDVANIESIDVIKGPSGTLFGGNLISYGGLINITTKKPYDDFGGELSYTLGSYNLNRLTADVNVPIGKLAFRLNTALHGENSFQDAGSSQSSIIAPSLKLQFNDRLSFLVNAEFRSLESSNAPMIFLNRYNPLSFSSIDVFEKNYFKSYTSNGLTMKNPSFNVQLRANYKISDNWNSQTIVSRSNTSTDGYYQYLWDQSTGDKFERFISKRNGYTTASNLQQNFTSDYSFGKIRNRLVLGIDYLHKEVVNSNSTGWVADGKVYLSNQKDSGSLTTAGVDALLVNSSEGLQKASTDIISVYASNVFNIIPQLSAMVSLRLDNYTGTPSYATEKITDQITLSPKLGLVFQPILDKISIFANYMNGFVNLPPSTINNINGGNSRIVIFKPEQANQWEVGVKGNLYKNKIAITASYYDITVSNKLMDNPTNADEKTQNGEVQSKGVEVSLVTNPIEGLSIISGFSYNDSKVTKDNQGSGYLGLRPEQAGPPTQFNFWANYKVPNGIFKNFSIGFGAKYADEHKTLNRSTTGTFILPSYLIFDAILSYGNDTYSISIKGDNLTDTRYYSGWSTVTPQRPFNLSFSVSYRF